MKLPDPCWRLTEVAEENGKVQKKTMKNNVVKVARFPQLAGHNMALGISGLEQKQTKQPVSWFLTSH